MTTTIANATLTVTLTESITLNGQNQGATNTLSLTNIDEVSKELLLYLHLKLQFCHFQQRYLMELM